MNGVWGRPTARWTPAFGEHRRAEISAKKQLLIDRLGEKRGVMCAEKDRLLGVFPNLAVHDIMGIVIRVVNPTSYDTIELTQYAMGAVGESAEDREMRLRNFLTFLGPAGFATPDDIEVIEACQRGLGVGERRNGPTSRAEWQSPTSSPAIGWTTSITFAGSRERGLRS